MTGGLTIALPDADPAVWRVVGLGRTARAASLEGLLPAGIFCLGLVATGGAGMALWEATAPATIVQTRIVANGPQDGSGRAALSQVALRYAGAAGQPVALEDGGDTLVVTERDRDPAEAQRLSDALVETVLNAPISPAPSSAAAQPATPEAALSAERARLTAVADTIEARAATVSSALTDLARDIAAASRAAADHKPGHETLDKGNAALADLQLQRLQLASKYQDTYPAVIALDSQIRNLRVFLMDEAHRTDGRPATPDPTDMLNRERDRLRTEAAQLDDRRRSVAADLAEVGRKLAALPAEQLTAIAAPGAPPPVLIATATTRSSAPDNRPATIQLLAAIGLALSAFAAMLARAWRRPGVSSALVLHQADGALLPAASPHPALSGAAFGWLPQQAAGQHRSRG